MATVLDPRVYTLATSMCIVGTSVGVVIPVMPLLVHELAISTSQFGLVVAAFGASKLIGNIPAAYLVERYGRRPCLIYSLLGIGTAMGGICFVHSFVGLAGARFATGLGVSLYIAASTMYNTDISTPLNRARTLAPVMAAFSAGMAIGPALGGYMAGTVGVHPTFVVVGAAFASTAGLNWMAITETKPPSLEKQPASLQENVATMMTQWRDLLQSKQLVSVLGLNAGYWVAISGGQMTLLPLLLTGDAFGLSPVEVGTAFAFMSAVSVVSSQPLAAVSDAIGARTAIVPGAVLTATGLGLIPMSSGHYELGGALSLLALGSVFLGTAPTAHVSNIVGPAQRAQALALLRTSGDVGLLMGAMAAGAVADWSDMQTAMEGSAGVLAAAATWFAVRSAAAGRAKLT